MTPVSLPVGEEARRYVHTDDEGATTEYELVPTGYGIGGGRLAQEGDHILFANGAFERLRTTDPLSYYMAGLDGALLNGAKLYRPVPPPSPSETLEEDPEEVRLALAYTRAASDYEDDGGQSAWVVRSDAFAAYERYRQAKKAEAALPREEEPRGPEPIEAVVTGLNADEDPSMELVTLRVPRGTLRIDRRLSLLSAPREARK